MKIFADFNGTEPCSSDDDKLCLNLTGFGTLASLSRHGVKLRRGMRLTFADSDGLTVTAAVEFDGRRISERSAGWYAIFRKGELRDENPIDHDFQTHFCFKCRNDFKPYLAKFGQRFDVRCPNCGTPVMYPLGPPDE
ncbi:hypothetical protein Q4S45_06885 [Massilia sp. R2A-15]|uniref:hypothetical protein n=1 Tax=Massilia sp. R2A-15 TaxID=3064278 RepID=UPI0027372A0D|nr:hypothetical protein [Massilia sp. R2A-15]WLI90836.1 hypothetical protein Q4S45_06885 [Massilia sp. R2A-15]